MKSIYGRRGAAPGLVLSVGLWPAGALVAQEDPTPRTIVEHVSVVDVEEGITRPGMTIVIAGDRIAQVVPDGRVTVDAATELVDGTGQFAIPGLWDMHTHVGYFGSLRTGPEMDLPLLLAHGVTGVREMGGCSAADEEMFPFHPCNGTKRMWDREVRAGRLAGPRILALASHSVNGPAQRPDEMNAHLPAFMNPLTADEGRRLAHYYGARLDVDFVKTYNGFPREAYLAFMSEAEAIGLTASGHVPFGVSIIEAARAGQQTMEHAYRILWDCYPGGPALLNAVAEEILTNSARGGAGYITTADRYEMIREHDAARCDAVFREMVRQEMWYVPTHVTRRFEAMAGDSAFMDDPRLRYITKERQEVWHEDVRSMVAIDPSPEGRQAFLDFYTFGLELTKRAHELGVRILVGSDLPDSYVFPGSGLLDELEELAKAGLSPIDILRAATIEPAAFMGTAHLHGSIAAGKMADLVLLSADPLRDIRNTRRITSVIMNGTVYDRAELDRLLEGVARAVQLADSTDRD